MADTAARETGVPGCLIGMILTAVRFKNAR